MTTEDVMKFCEKGSHKYEEADILKSLKEDTLYILFHCKVCPSTWVRSI